MGERAAETTFDEISVSSEKQSEDPLPEYCHYRDEGCDLSDSCLNCPFDECVYERRGGKQRWMKEERAAEMTRLIAEEGKSIPELAALFGVSNRTVQRDLKKHIGNVNRRNLHGS